MEIPKITRLTQIKKCHGINYVNYKNRQIAIRCFHFSKVRMYFAIVGLICSERFEELRGYANK